MLLRQLSFTGGGYDVLNVIALPRMNTSLPILGIDVVSLPGAKSSCELLTDFLKSSQVVHL